MFKQRSFHLFSLFFLLVIAGCRPSAAPAATTAATDTPVSLTPSAVPTATSTPIPLAVKVNGEGIFLSDFQEELKRFQTAQTEVGGSLSDKDAQQQVLDELVDQTLLAQGATEAGFKMTDQLLQDRLKQLTDEIGGEQALVDWMNKYGYTQSSLNSALARSIAAAWQQEHILSTLPEKAEQVHARQILLMQENTANTLYASLKSGTDFSTLAFQYDPTTGGDLGWFPRGYLTQPAVEEAAFKLNPGEFSEVIKTDFGYQIIFCVEKDPQRTLSTGAQKTLQLNLLTQWLKERRAKSQIEVLVN